MEKSRMQGERLKMSIGCLRSLDTRIKTGIDSFMEITTLAQAHFQILLSVNTAHYAIHKSRLKPYHGKNKPYVIQKHHCLLWAKAGWSKSAFNILFEAVSVSLVKQLTDTCTVF